MPDTTLRATARQMRILMILALAGAGLTVVFGCVGTAYPNAFIGAALAGVVAVVFVPVWLVYLTAFVRLDERGVTSRLIRTRYCDWKDVESIRVHAAVSTRGPTTYTVRVKPRRAAEFRLSVPVSGGAMADRDFDTRVRLVETAWQLRGGREIPVPR